jgi:hypothetical protein
VRNEDKILRQLEGMPFEDENANKSNPESNKKKGEKQKKSNPNEQPESNYVLWKKNSIFFRVLY